jgi:hypothetical protein
MNAQDELIGDEGVGLLVPVVLQDAEIYMDREF